MKTLAPEVIEKLNSAMDRNETCEFCKYAIDNPKKYYTKICGFNEDLPILVNNDYSTCQKFEKSEIEEE